MVGAEAEKVFKEAQVLLEQIVSEGLLKANGIVGIFPANAVNDDIIVYDEKGVEIRGTLHGLRQQVRTYWISVTIAGHFCVLFLFSIDVVCMCFF